MRRLLRRLFGPAALAVRVAELELENHMLKRNERFLLRLGARVTLARSGVAETREMIEAEAARRSAPASEG